ncbi:MAG: circadian clock KaiB family protein [Anaerolineae bacterium]|nr:circadian clock KaiB family protein [Anaerolineae bacterium]
MMPATPGDPASVPPDAPSPAPWQLRLYIVEGRVAHHLALANLQRVCDQYLAGRYQLEVIDVTQHPEAAAQDQVHNTPTLVRVSPLPVRHVTGDFSHAALVVLALGLGAEPDA